MFQSKIITTISSYYSILYAKKLGTPLLVKTMAQAIKYANIDLQYLYKIYKVNKSYQF